jgi:Protein of unknown function (DUF3489)
MKTYTIDRGNNVTAFATVEEAKVNLEAERFSSIDQLSAVANHWPASRLVEIWNTLPGVTPVKKFTSRNTAARRIWSAIQSLDPQEKRASARARSSHKLYQKVTPPGSKKAKLLNLLRREGGATLQDLTSTTGWQAHSVRGFLSGALGKKMGSPSNRSNVTTESGSTRSPDIHASHPESFSEFWLRPSPTPRVESTTCAFRSDSMSSRSSAAIRIIPRRSWATSW